jgi:hypothetical protein
MTLGQLHIRVVILQKNINKKRKKKKNMLFISSKMLAHSNEMQPNSHVSYVRAHHSPAKEQQPTNVIISRADPMSLHASDSYHLHALDETLLDCKSSSGYLT